MVVKASACFVLLFCWNRRQFEMPMTEFYVIEPDGTKVALSNALGSTYTYRKLGRHKFIQLYYINGATGVGIETEGKVSLTWTINVVETEEEKLRKYNIREVVTRLLACANVKRANNESQNFILDEALSDKLETIESPEFVFSGGTLREALGAIGGCIHAEPKIIPQILYNKDENGNVISVDDYSNWNTVSFDFLGGRDLFEKDDYSLIDSSFVANNYAIDVVTYVQNGTQSNYSNNATLTEPFGGGYVSPRSEEASFEITNDSLRIKLSSNILFLRKLVCVSNGVEIDITDRVLEKAKYDLLSAYCLKESDTEAKNLYLYYERGNNYIGGLTYISEGDKSIYKERAITNILKNIKNLESESNLKNLAFRIEYVPYLNFKVKQYKSKIDDDEVENELFYNQNSSIVDIEALGEQTKGALLRTGNRDFSETQYFNNYSDLPKKGQVSKDGFYASVISSELYVGVQTKATTDWSYRYNKINDYTAIKKAIREYEISENECYDRNIDYQEFCIVSTKLDIENYYNSEALEGSEEKKISDSIVEELRNVAFASDGILNQIVHKFNGQTGFESKKISYAIITTNGENAYGEKVSNSFVLPVSVFPYGNSVVLYFRTLDNYAAQTYSRKVILDEESNTEATYNLEEYIEYGDEFGRFDTMSVCYGCNNPFLSCNWTDKADIYTYSQKLYKFDEEVNEADILIDYRQNPFCVDKDSRSQISCTAQLNFCEEGQDVIIGKGLAHTMPMLGNNSVKYKFVYFNTAPNVLNTTIDSETYTTGEMPSMEYKLDIKTIIVKKTNVLTNCIGYGILDEKDRLVFYVEDAKTAGEQTKPIYLMFRSRR